MDKDNVVDLSVEILQQLRTELRAGFRGVEERLGGVEERLGTVEVGLRELRGEMRTLEAETMRGFTGVRAELDRTHARLDVSNARLDNLLEISTDRHRALERRVEALERRRTR